MSGPIVRLWITLLVILTVISPQVMAQQLQIRIVANQYLYSGRVSDGTELATVYISQIEDGCILNVWDTEGKKEAMPGYYIIHNRQRANNHLIVRLSGEDWQPDIKTGKGVTFRKTVKFTTLKILSSGEQFMNSSIWPLNISAQCSRQ